MNRRNFLHTAITCAAAGPLILTSKAQTARRPNVLVLLTDDQSYETFSLTGNPFMRTPHMDRIGREGVLFTNAFVAMSLCAPSRACFLTGLYPHSNGIIGNQIPWNQEHQTLPRLLQQNGYRTAHIGKFHMDGDDRRHPGYDYWATQVGQGQYVDPRKNINGTWTGLKGYDTTLVTDQAIEFMRDSRKRGQPFCTWIGYKACHGPFTPAPGHENDFSSVEFKPPASFFLDDTGKPDRVRARSQHRVISGGSATNRRKRREKKKRAGEAPPTLAAWANRERDQYRCLMGVEDSIGRLFAFLDEQKITDDTIIFFSGDNGFFHGEHGLHGKMEAYEEALRVPMMVRYPKAIKSGQRISRFVANIDMAPSLLDLCGVRPAKPIEGLSWKNIVSGKGGPWRDSFVYSMHRGDDAAHPTVKALRTDRYKLILNLNPNDKDELYDIRDDPKEMKNLAAGQKDVVAGLKRKLITEMKAIRDPAVASIPV